MVGCGGKQKVPDRSWASVQGPCPETARERAHSHRDRVRLGLSVIRRGNVTMSCDIRKVL